MTTARTVTLWIAFVALFPVAVWKACVLLAWLLTELRNG